MDDDQTPWARAEKGYVIVGTDCECRDADSFTPDAARSAAAELLAAADECDRQRAAIVAACADGHDWGEFHNGWQPYPDSKVCIRHCRREGCDGHDIQPGWMQFAGRLHHDPVSGRRIECYGPGCEACDDEKLGAAMYKILTDGMAAVDAAVLGDVFVVKHLEERTDD